MSDYKYWEMVKMFPKGKGFYFILGMSICKYFIDKVNREKDYAIEKKNLYIQILDRWLMLRDKGISLSRYLKNKGYKKVAIYGLGIIGNHLYEELKKAKIDIVGIDQSEIYDNFQMPVYKPDHNFEDIDLIIVTPFEYGDIFQRLQKYQKKLITIHKLLDECEKYLYP